MSALEELVTPTEEQPPETVTETVQVFCVGEFRGSSPKIDAAPGVDIAQLTANDPDPVFITMPLAESGRVSANGLVYDDFLIDTITEQINAKRPVGIWGHIKPEDRSTNFPNHAVIWIGARRIGGVVWGKGYVPPGESRERIRQLKAAGAKLGTSIYGVGTFAESANGKRRFAKFNLEQVDFAPHERAALDMGGDYVVTAEMNKDTIMPETKDNRAVIEKAFAEMSDEDLYAAMGDERMGKMMSLWAKKNKKKMVEAEMLTIAELTADNAAALPEVVRDAIIAQHNPADTPEVQAQISELTHKLDAERTAREQLQAVVAEQKAAAFDRALTDVVNGYVTWTPHSDDGKKAVDALRKQLRQQIVFELKGSQDVQVLAETAQAVWSSDVMQIIAEAVRDKLAGPSAIIGGKPRSATTDPTPDEIAAARAATGI